MQYINARNTLHNMQCSLIFNMQYTKKLLFPFKIFMKVSVKSKYTFVSVIHGLNKVWSVKMWEDPNIRYFTTISSEHRDGKLHCFFKIWVREYAKYTYLELNFYCHVMCRLHLLSSCPVLCYSYSTILPKSKTF